MTRNTITPPDGFAHYQDKGPQSKVSQAAKDTVAEPKEGPDSAPAVSMSKIDDHYMLVELDPALSKVELGTATSNIDVESKKLAAHPHSKIAVKGPHPIVESKVNPVESVNTVEVKDMEDGDTKVLEALRKPEYQVHVAAFNRAFPSWI